MKKIIFAIIALAIIDAFTFTACSTLETESVSLSGFTQPITAHVYTVEELFPEGDAESFVILPRSGWEVRYGEVITFTALLLDEKTGIYRDVTFDSNCKFSSAYGSGITVSGSRPSLRNGQEITVWATYAGRFGAESIGHYVVDPEWERPSVE